MPIDTNKPSLEPSKRPETTKPELVKAEATIRPEPMKAKTEIPAVTKPGMSPEPEKAMKAEPKKASKLVLAAAAVGLALAGVFGMQAVAPDSFLGGIFLASGDHVNSADMQTRQQKFDNFVKSGGFHVVGPALSVEAAKATVAGMTIGHPDLQTIQKLHTDKPVAFVDQQSQPVLQKAVENGTYKLVPVMAFDDCSIDGDVIALSSSGTPGTPAFTYVIPLFGTPTTVYIPVAANGGPTMVTMTGVYDGGGGITAALGAPGAETPVPLMTGQQVQFPIQ